MPIHHIDMHPICACLIDSPDLFAELGEVGGQDRGRDNDLL